MTDYAWPAELQPQSNTLTWVDAVDVFRSPLSDAVRTLERGPGHWQLRMSFDRFMPRHAQLLEAFLWRLDGMTHRAVIPDHAYRRQGTGALPHAPHSHARVVREQQGMQQGAGQQHLAHCEWQHIRR